jgi:DNA processing protein
MEVLPLSVEAYPASLRDLPDPPAVLFTLGDRSLLHESGAVTVVGSRRATQRGRDVAERLGAALARRGGTVVSGLALGVDGSAHLGALDASDGRTVAVLGNGADVVYPRSHRHLYERIRSRGLLVSEFTPGAGAQPHHFPRRNRVLAALASATVVVEAGSRSGALITVDHALDLGRDVWAVPGPIDSSACQGSNRLLADGARPLVSIDDFVSAVCATGSAGGGAAVGGDERERRILAALASETVSVDRLVEALGLPVAEVLSLLTLLEIHGEVRRLPGMRFRRAA